MSAARGFWSYARRDDDAEGGRIACLAQDIVAQYEMITGDSIELFLDRDSLEWGDPWKPKIDATVTSAAFFIAILTPRYFQREECRREFNLFARKAKELGVDELVLPVLYIDFPKYRDPSPTDPLIALANSFVHADWTQVRFADRGSSEYRLAVGDLARRLARASAAAEAVDVDRPASEPDPAEDDAPGFVELAAQAEIALPLWAATMEGITVEVAGLGTVFEDATRRIAAGDAGQKGFAHRMDVMREVAVALVEPVDRIYDLGGEFSRQLLDVDPGVREIISRIPGEMGADPRSDAVLVDFAGNIRQLTEAAEVGLGSVRDFVETIEPVERESRVLRPVLRKLRDSLALMVDGLDTMRVWRRMIDELDLPEADLAALSPARPTLPG